MNNLWNTPRPSSALRNSHGHAKGFLRNLDNLGRRPQKDHPALYYAEG